MNAKTGIERIAEERARQLNELGWNAAHDAQHADGELVQAASYYMLTSSKEIAAAIWPLGWHEYWMNREGFPVPTDRDLEKAGALIAAELDRRAAAS